MEKHVYQKETAEVMDELHTSLQGLDSDEAAQRLARDGANALEESKPPHPFMIFLSQFKDLLVLILIVAAIISMISGELESTIVILAVITMNSILGTVQTVKAQKSLDALKQLSTPSARVIRGGMKQVNGAAQPSFNLYVNGCDIKGEEAFGQDFGAMLAENIPAFLVELGLSVQAEESSFAAWYPAHGEEFRRLAEKYLA